MRDMIGRQPLALAAGVALGIIIQESLWIGVDALIPEHSLNRALVHAPLSDGWLAPLLAAWLAGGAFGGLMATLIGRNRIIGHVTGLLLSGSGLLVAAFALPDAGRFLVVAGTPSAGAALGTWLGIALLMAEADRQTSPGVAKPPLTQLP